jgi:choline-sulfatase
MSKRAVSVAWALLAAGAACGASAVAPSSGAPSSGAPSTAAAPPTASASATSTAAVSPPPPAPPRVLVISIDSLRADMPWAGYGRDMAPRLTAFAKQAVRYSRFYALSSYTAMSVSGLLSGRYASELDRTSFFFANFHDSNVMVPELLQKAGVRTLSAQAHFYLDQKAGFRQGFDLYEMVPGLQADNHTDLNVTSPEHLSIALRQLGDKSSASGPLFAWYHFMDPHDRYVGHEGFGPFGKKARDRYDAEVMFTDHHVGKLLDFVDAQPWGASTTIVVTADHGEAFGEHKLTRHGFELYDVLVHVPLLVRTPGGTPRQIDEPRSAIDLAPSVLELFGAPKEPAMHGTSLVSEWRGGATPSRDVVIDLPRTSDNDRKRALVSGRYKLIAHGDDFSFELFDVVADPGELRDLRRAEPKVFEDMQARYREASGRIRERCPNPVRKMRGRKPGKPC